MKLYMFRAVPLRIIKSLFTVHSALVYLIQVCRQLSSRTRMELQFLPGPARKLSTNLYDNAECTVNKLLMMGRETARNVWSFPNLFGKLHMFRAVSLSIISSLFNVHSALVYLIQVCRQL